MTQKNRGSGLTGADQGNKRVLVIDDDRELWSVYQEVLSPGEDRLHPARRELAALLDITRQDEPAEPNRFELYFAPQGREGWRLVQQALARGQPFALACIDIRMPPGWDGMETARRIRQLDPDIEMVIITAYSDHSRNEIVDTVGAADKLLLLRKPFDPEELTQLALSLTTKWNLARQRALQMDALRESEERFRQIAENIKGAFWVRDTDGKMIYISPGYEELFGRSCESLYNDPESWLEAVHPEDRARAMACHAGPPADSRAVEYRVLLAGGISRWVRSRSFPVRDPAGKIYRETGFAEDITEARQAAARIRYLSRRVIQVAEEERKRIARDLHDEFGQLLPSLRHNLEAVIDCLPPGLADCRPAAEVNALIEKLGSLVRNIATELRPDMLDRLGFIATARWHINDFSIRHPGTRIDFNVVGAGKDLSPEIEIVLFRVFQEGLNNIAKHAAADHITVLVTFSHPDIILTVTDNGKGFNADRVMEDRPGTVGGGIGLIGMRERVASVNGTLTIRSGPGKGTLIRAELPVL